jgi:bacillithiol biosynthesis cysteine-adding enzyme BshC
MSASFASAWSAGDPAAEALLPVLHRDRQACADRVRSAMRSLDPRLAVALADANRGRNDPTVDARLEQLAGPVVFVATGQQLGLFLGPVYTIVKALAAVHWARRLEAQTGVPVLPLFWLQTEDHDFAEVARWTGPSGPGTKRSVIEVGLTEPDDEARVALGDRTLPPDVEGVVAAVTRELGAGVDAERVSAWLGSAYRPGARWSEAFVELLSHVLSGLGLLVFDPRHPDAARAAAPIHRVAFERHAELRTGLEARAAELESAGFAVRVPVRAEALPFVHPDGPTGPRYRAARVDEGWRLAGTAARIDDADVDRWLDDEPRRFSSSALLRPVLQDSLLPVAAQVAGPGEIAYLAQCQPLWSAFDVHPGIIVPRPQVRLVEPWARRLGDRWRVQPSDVHASVDETLGRMAPPAGPGPDEVRDRVLGAWRATSSSVADLGADVEPARRALEVRLRVAAERFAKKYDRIRQRRDRDRVAAAERLTSAFFPGGAPQERGFGIIPFLARYGARHVVERIAESIDRETTSAMDVDL